MLSYIYISYLVERSSDIIMNALIGYILLMTLMFSLAAGLYYGLKTIRLI
jgi:hypothetical protein